MSLDDWDLVMNVHLNGSAYVTHAAWPIMYEKNFGRIVLTSSTSGIYGNFGQANYGAAKMGMLGLINVLAIEGASKNIRVNGLAPSAATRLIATIPGREDLDPENPDADVHETRHAGGAADGRRKRTEWQDYSGWRRTLLNLRGLQ